MRVWKVGAEYMDYLNQVYWPINSSRNIYQQMAILKFLILLTSSSMNPRLMLSFPCIHTTCEIYGNPSIVTCTSHHIPHLTVDGLVVRISCQPLAHILGGLWPGWREPICMDCNTGLSDHSYTFTRPEKRVETCPWPLDLVSHPTPPCWWLGGLQVLKNLGP